MRAGLAIVYFSLQFDQSDRRTKSIQSTRHFKMKTQFLLLDIAFLCCIGHLTSRNTNKERIKREKRLKRNIDFSTNGRMQSEFYFINYFANSLIKYNGVKAQGRQEVVRLD